MAKQFISGCWRPSHGKSIKQSPAEQQKKKKENELKITQKSSKTATHVSAEI